MDLHTDHSQFVTNLVHINVLDACALDDRLGRQVLHVQMHIEVDFVLEGSLQSFLRLEKEHAVQWWLHQQLVIFLRWLIYLRRDGNSQCLPNYLVQNCLPHLLYFL